MKKFIFPLLLLIAGSCAQAATYYVSDCESGASAQCKAGNDANPGTSTSLAWKTCAKVASQFSKLAAGDQVLFARGSAQTACTMNYLYNLNSTKATPITLGAYDAPWATGTLPNPVLNGTTSAYTLSLLNSGNSLHDEGYVIQDLHFKGVGTTSTTFAIMLGNDVDHVTLQRLEIDNQRAGIMCDGGTTNPQAVGSDGLTEHIVIRDSNIHHNRGTGLLLACNDSLIENNKFDNNGVGMMDHHIYLDDGALNKVALTTTQVVIRGNTLTNNAPYASTSAATPTPGSCGASAIVIHGLKNGIFIENNVVSEPTLPKNGSCWGIAADTGDYGGIYQTEGFWNVVIRGNSVINYPMAIGLGMCNTCTVENNAVYSEYAGAVGITAPGVFFRPLAAGKAPNDKLLIRNNTIYIKNPTYMSIGVRINREGTQHAVASNLIYFGTGTTSASACFNTSGLAVSAFAAFDNNLCYFSAMQGAWDAARTTLAQQQAAGLDKNSLAVNPSLNVPLAPLFALTVTAGSPALNKGHPSMSSKFAKGGIKRDASPDIGAYEGGGTTVVPSSPTGMTLK